MKKRIPFAVAISALVILGLTGCGHKAPNPQSEIDKATQVMAQTASPPATAAATPTAVAAPPPAAQQMNEAVASYKNGDLEDAVTRFQRMRNHGALTGEQLQALNNAMAAVMGDIYMRAAKGDAKAQAAVKEYERMQNGH
jgi:predicted small lipoprotein YifL